MTQGKCKEPSLSELMREPIIRAVMARDEVQEAEIRRLLERVRRDYRSDEQRLAEELLQTC